jgi:hypothetical protein
MLPFDVVLTICSYLDDINDVRALSKALGGIRGLSSLYYTSMTIISERRDETRCTLNTTTFAGGLTGPQYIAVFTKYEGLCVQVVRNRRDRSGRAVYSTSCDVRAVRNEKWSRVDPVFKEWVEGMSIDYNIKPKLLIRTKVPRKRDLVL